jgi:hypothetical protein
MTESGQMILLARCSQNKSNHMRYSWEDLEHTGSWGAAASEKRSTLAAEVRVLLSI